jgi:hypothetical protein
MCALFKDLVRSYSELLLLTREQVGLTSLALASVLRVDPSSWDDVECVPVIEAVIEFLDADLLDLFVVRLQGWNAEVEGGRWISALLARAAESARLYSQFEYFVSVSSLGCFDFAGFAASLDPSRLRPEFFAALVRQTAEAVKTGRLTGMDLAGLRAASSAWLADQMAGPGELVVFQRRVLEALADEEEVHVLEAETASETLLWLFDWQLPESRYVFVGSGLMLGELLELMTDGWGLAPTRGRAALLFFHMLVSAAKERELFREMELLLFARASPADVQAIASLERVERDGQAILSACDVGIAVGCCEALWGELKDLISS